MLQERLRCCRKLSRISKKRLCKFATYHYHRHTITTIPSWRLSSLVRSVVSISSIHQNIRFNFQIDSLLSSNRINEVVDMIRYVPFLVVILRGSAFALLCAHRFSSTNHVASGQPPDVPFFCTGPEVDSLRRMERFMSCTWMTEPKGTQLPLAVWTVSPGVVQLRGHARGVVETACSRELRSGELHHHRISHRSHHRNRAPTAK